MQAVKVYKMRNHNLNIEEDPIELMEFENLTDEQAEFLRTVVADTVWYDSEVVQ